MSALADERRPPTPRQVEVLRLLAEGEPTKRVAVALGISRDTVKRHRADLLLRLGARNATHAVALAFRGGWLG